MANPFRRQPTRAQSAPFTATRAITAAATRISLRNNREVEEIRNRASQQAWQNEAWVYYDSVGEIKFAFGLVASILSRLRLYAGVVVDPESPPVPVSQGVKIDRPDPVEGDDTQDDGALARAASGIDPRLAKDARDMLAKAFSRTSIPNMLRSFALNTAVPGECYLILHKGQWTIRSTSELTIDSASRIQLRPSAAQGREPEILERDTPIGRIWRQHPRYSSDPDSSMRGVATDCEELLLLGRMIRANARAGLNAGILFIPDEISVAAHSHSDATPEEGEEEGDPLETELIYSITEPINTETSGASAVPLLLRGPSELGDKIKHILLERKSDEFLLARADRTLERILQGLDVPKDIVTGLANVKYSNAIQIDENLYKAHVEPLALMLCDAVTEIVLRPLLSASGYDDDDVAKIVVWYDPSEIVTRPDRAKDADEGYDKYLLSGSAWRNSHGFGDTDAPDEDELARRLALEKATVPPEIATELFAELLPTLLKAARAANTEGAEALPDELSAMLSGSPDVPATADLTQSSVPS